MQQPVLLSPKFGGLSLHIFMQSQQNFTLLCGIDCLAFRDILCKQSPWCQRKLWACTWLCSGSVSPFLDSVNLDCSSHMPVYGSCFFAERLSNHCQGSMPHFFWDLHKIWCTLTLRSIVKLQQTKYTIQHKRICMSTQLWGILYTDAKDTLALSYAIESCYYNCCSDGSISSGNYT
jgi:hypothetical protein